MGKKIDRFMLTLIPGIMIWLILSKRTENKFLPFAAALAACIIFRKLLRRIIGISGNIPFFRKKNIQKNSGAAIMRIASLPGEQAEADVNALIHKCYPETEFELEIIQQHPALKLSESNVFQAWRKHIGKERLVICSTCRTEPVVRAFAGSLSAPKISLIDSDMLAQMIAEYPEGMIPENTPKAKMRLRHAANLLVNRKNAPRNLLFACTTILMYLLTSNILYLASAVFLLIIAFLSIKRKLRPHKLF